MAAERSAQPAEKPAEETAEQEPAEQQPAERPWRLVLGFAPYDIVNARGIETRYCWLRQDRSPEMLVDLERAREQALAALNQWGFA